MQTPPATPANRQKNTANRPIPTHSLSQSRPAVVGYARAGERTPPWALHYPRDHTHATQVARATLHPRTWNLGLAKREVAR